MIYDDKTVLLNQMRSKARAAYVYLAFGMVMLIAVFLIFNTLILEIGFALFILTLYICLFRKDICNFRDQFKKEAVLCSISGRIDGKEYVEKNLLSLTEIAEDGCIPVNNNTQGLVRVGVVGNYNGAEIYITDISYQYLTNGGRGKNVNAISGCYLKLRWEDVPQTISVYPCILCEKEAISNTILEEYYALHGLQKCQLPHAPLEVNAHWDCYCSDTDGTEFLELIYSFLCKIAQKSNGGVIIKYSCQGICVFMRGRYLGICEPDLRIPVTAENLKFEVLPELDGILDLASLKYEEERKKRNGNA